MTKGKKSLYANLFTIGSYSYSYTFLQFLASIVISRLLAPSEYGVVAMITVFTGFVAYFKDAGISYVVIREDYGRQFHRKVQGLTVIVGAILALIVIVLAYPISIFYELHQLFLPTLLVALVMFIEAITIVPVAILKKHQEFNFIGRINFLGYVSGSSATIILAFLGLSFWSLILGQLLAVIIIYFLSQSKFRIYFGDTNRVSIIAAWMKAKTVISNISGSRFIQYWSSNADNLIIGKMYGPASLGLYNRAYQLLIMQMNLISGLFNTILLPSLKEDKKHSDELVIASYQNALRLMALVVLPITAVLVLFPTDIVSFIWGEKWRGVAAFVSYFGIMSITFVLSRTFGNIYILFHKENLLFKIGMFSAVVSVLSIVFGSLFGSIEVALFITFTFVTIVLPVTLYLAFYRGFMFPFKILVLFWLPKIVLSQILILAVYLDYRRIVELGIGLLIIHICCQGRSHIIKFIDFVKRKTVG